MDRHNSPTSIRYTYSNSSITDSIGISRSLERSIHNNSSGVYSARVGVYDYINNNFDSGPIIQHASQSAQVQISNKQSSSVPSQYMNDSSQPISGRNNLAASQGISRPASHHINTQGLALQHRNPQVGSHQNQQANLSALNRQSYQLQIQELKLLLSEQNKQISEKQILEAKYERCLQQMDAMYQQNEQLRNALNKMNDGSIDVNKSYLSSQKNSQLNKTKQQEIRRLKDSVIVLKKEKDSYQEQTHQLISKMNELQSKNDEYENKIVLISHEIQRLNRVNNDKNEEKTELLKLNQDLRRQVGRVQQENQKLLSLKTMQGEKSSQYLKKMQDLYNRIENLNKSKLQSESELRKVSYENKMKQQDYCLQIQKLRLQINMIKRENEDLVLSNRKLEQELKSLSQKNSNSQMFLTNVETQTGKLQEIIKQLQQKLKMLEKQYQRQIDKLTNLSQENASMRNSLKITQEQITRIKMQSERYEQESIQLRRKIQQISLSSQRQRHSLQENINSRQIKLREIEYILRQTEAYNHQVQIKNRELGNTLRFFQQKNQQVYTNLQRVNEQTKEKTAQFERQKQLLAQQLVEKDNLLKRIEQSSEGKKQKTIQAQKNLLNLTAQFQKLQFVVTSLQSKKNLDEAKIRDFFTHQITEIENALNVQRKHKGELQIQLQFNQKEIQKLQIEVNSLRKIRTQLQNSMNQLEQSLKKHKQQYNLLQQSYSSLQRQLKAQIASTKQISFKHSQQIEAEKSQYFDEISKKQLEVHLLQQKVQEQQSMLVSLEKRSEERQKRLAEQSLELDEAKQKNIHLESELQGKRIQNQHLHQQLQFVKQTQYTKQKSLQQAQQQLNQYLKEKENRLNQKNEDIWKLQNELNNLIQKLKHSQKQNHISKQNFGRLQLQTNNIVEGNRKLEKENRECSDKIKLRDRQNAQLRNIVHILQQKAKILQNELNESINKNRQVDQAKGSLQQKNKNLELAYSDVKLKFDQYVNQARANINRLEQQGKQGEAQFHKLQHQYQSVKIHLQECSRQIQKMYKPMEQNYKNLEVQNKQVQRKARELQGICKQLRTGQKYLKQQIRSLAEEKEMQKLQIQELEGHSKNLQNQLSQFKKEVQHFQDHNNHIQNQSNESLNQLQIKNVAISNENQRYRQNLLNLSTRYQSLQYQYKGSRENLEQLQMRHRQIEVRYTSLESQLNALRDQYLQLTEIHKGNDQEMGQLRETLKRMDQQKIQLHYQNKKVEIKLREQLEDKGLILDDLKKQVEVRDNIIKEMKNQLDIKQNSLHHLKLHNQKNHRRIQELENNLRDYQSHIHQTEQKCQQFDIQVYQYRQENELLSKKIAQSRNQIIQKQEVIKQMEYTIGSYLEKINSLNSEIGKMNDQLGNSRVVASRELQTVAQAKNNHIRQLQREIIERQEKFRKQITLISHEGQRKSEQKLKRIGQQHMLKVQKLQKQIYQLQQQLESESSQYTQLVNKLQSIIRINQQSFQQIIHSLQTVLELNNQLVIQISKSNNNIVNTISSNFIKMQERLGQKIKEVDDGKMKNFGILTQIKDLIAKGKEEQMERIERVEQRQVNKERMERKDKQQALEREQRIIRLFQQEKERFKLEREEDRKKYEELITKNKDNKDQKGEIEKISKLISSQIKQELNKRVEKYQKGENEDSEQSKSSRYVQQITINILKKMENLTNLFVDNHQWYKNNVGTLQARIFQLQQLNVRLHEQIQVEKQRSSQIEKKCFIQKKQLQSRFSTSRLKIQSDQNNNPKGEPPGYEPQLERFRIQNEQMRRQYDDIVCQYQRTNQSLVKELEIARKQMDWLNAKLSQRQMEGRGNPNDQKQGDNFLKMKQFEQKNKQIRVTIEKYQGQIALLSQQIERLHLVITEYQQKISFMEKIKTRQLDQKRGQFDNFVHPEIDKLKRLLSEREKEIEGLKQSFQTNLSTSFICSQIIELRKKVIKTQNENASLQSQIDRSLKTIQSLTSKIQTIKKSYKQMSDYGQTIQNKILDLYGKYNSQLIRKNRFQEESQRFNQNTVRQIEQENIKLKNHLSQIQMRNQELKTQFSKMENIIQALKHDNVSLRRINYSYEVESQKINFHKEKIMKLSNEIDRISRINIELTQELSQCRLAIGDDLTINRRLQDSYVIIVMMGAEIEALRIQIDQHKSDGSRKGSRQKNGSNSSEKEEKKWVDQKMQRWKKSGQIQQNARSIYRKQNFANDKNLHLLRKETKQFEGIPNSKIQKKLDDSVTTHIKGSAVFEPRLSSLLKQNFRPTHKHKQIYAGSRSP